MIYLFFRLDEKSNLIEFPKIGQDQNLDIEVVRETNVNALMYVLGKFSAPKVGRNVVKWEEEKKMQGETQVDEKKLNKTKRIDSYNK